MKKLTDAIGLRCDDPMFQKVSGTFQCSLSSLIALIQAVQYARDNKKDYLKKYTCKECFEEVKVVHSILSEAIQEGIAHAQLHKKGAVKN